ncbi:MAG: translocation/assembly module TamB [Tannerellaceae bacterium]|jgi:hypothetical protein|nr:translocation/assembly module TamB [Tannerellaceae bacterium]
MKIKKLQHITFLLLILASLLLIAPVVLLNIPDVQRRVKDRVVSELSAQLRVPVRVGKVGLEWLSSLTAEDLYLEDRNGRTLFEADYVAARFSPLRLLQGEWVFTSLGVLGFSISLYKDAPERETNLQFLLDAFRRDSTQQPAGVDLQINSIRLRRGEIRFDVWSEEATPDKFNLSHIALKNISANVSLPVLRSDSLNAHIRKMSFVENSGLVVNKLSVSVVGNRDSVNLSDFEIRLPGSLLKITRAGMDYSRVTQTDELLSKAPLNLLIAPSELYPKELAAFIPALDRFGDAVELSAEASGCINDIHLRRLTLRYGDKMQFTGKMQLKGITRPEETYLLGEVSRMYLNPVILPKSLKGLGSVYFRGEISGFFNHLVAYGKLSSDIGSIETDLLFGSDREKQIAAYVQGHISSSELSVGELFEGDNPFGIARFDVSIDAQCPEGGSFAGNIRARVSELDFRNYRYENLLLSGDFRQNGFEGILRMEDPNVAVYAEGMFRNDKHDPVFNFRADLRHFRPDHLNLYDKLASPEISVSIDADFAGNTIDNLRGSITVDSLKIHTEAHDFLLKQLKVTASGEAPDKRLVVSSDLVNGEVSGVYSFATLFPGVLNTLRNYLPALINTTTKSRSTEENNFSLLLTVENTQALSATLKLPLTLMSQGRITGFYNSAFNKFRTEIFLPDFLVGESRFESCYFTCENPLDKIDLRLRATHYGKQVRNYLTWEAEAKDNRIGSLFQWANNKERRFEARLRASALFTEEQEGTRPRLRTEVHLEESPLVINDSVWSISEADFRLGKGRIEVRDFRIAHEGEGICLDGVVSDNPADTLLLELNRIELGYLFEALNISKLRFGGIATGLFHLSDAYAKRVLNGNLYVQDFSFNRVGLGDLNLFSRWDNLREGVRMTGNVYEHDTVQTNVNGYIYPVGKRAGIDLSFLSENLNVSFLAPYLDDVASGLRGRATGHARLFGSFRDIDLEGEVLVKEGGLSVDVLNTSYAFADSIHLRPGSIGMEDVTLRDAFGNTGRVTAEVRHAYFRDFEFSVDIRTDRMLVYNATESQSPMIYGSVFAGGTSRIQGNEQLIRFDVNMRSEPETSVSFNFTGGGNTATAYDFLVFRDASPSAVVPSASVAAPPVSSSPPPDSGTELQMNFTLDVTPEANLELVIDPLSGDKIKGYGNGSLQIAYGTKSDLRMYGIFHILSGSYHFSLQQLIHKDFKIRQGSSVSFGGDPLEATLDIDAIYNLTANIGDLDPNLLEESARTNIPVNCVLLLEGMFRNPSISFDLELPGANTELESKVRSYANTEDMLTRQIVYLLVLNKFHPSDFTQAPLGSEFSAVTSAAISSQLSGILSAMTDRVQIGTNIRTGQEGISETEVEMLLSGQLWDNRLLFNGNFGYRNNPTVKNVFVGEFDLEYLLTPGGEFRLKAYNRANEMYRYLKQSLTTQGFGIMYRKDFSSFPELFLRRRR